MLKHFQAVREFVQAKTMRMGPIALKWYLGEIVPEGESAVGLLN